MNRPKKSVLGLFEEALDNFSVIIEKEKDLNKEIGKETLKAMEDVGKIASETLVKIGEQLKVEVGPKVDDLVDSIIKFSQELKKETKETVEHAMGFDLHEQRESKTGSGETKTPKFDEQDLREMKLNAILDSLKNLQTAKFSEEDARFIMVSIHEKMSIHPLQLDQCSLLFEASSKMFGCDHLTLIAKLAGEMIRK